MVEIAAHGSPVILDLLLRLAFRRGARLGGRASSRSGLSFQGELTSRKPKRCGT